MTWRSGLIGLLGFSVVLDGALAGAGFGLRAWMLAQFGVAYTPDSSFLAFVLAWMLVLVTAVCAYTAIAVLRAERAGWILSKILGIWWIGIGLALFVKYGRIDNLIFDAVKGLLITVCAIKSTPKTAL